MEPRFITEGSIIQLPDNTTKYRVEHREWFMYQNSLVRGWCFVPLTVDAPIPATVKLLNQCTILQLGDGEIISMDLAFNASGSYYITTDGYIYCTVEGEKYRLKEGVIT